MKKLLMLLLVLTLFSCKKEEVEYRTIRVEAELYTYDPPIEGWSPMDVGVSVYPSHNIKDEYGGKKHIGLNLGFHNKGRDIIDNIVFKKGDMFELYNCQSFTRGNYCSLFEYYVWIYIDDELVTFLDKGRCDIVKSNSWGMGVTDELIGNKNCYISFITP
jgi:hypothetical protein